MGTWVHVSVETKQIQPEEESDNKEVDKKNPKHSAVVFTTNFN